MAQMTIPKRTNSSKFMNWKEVGSLKISLSGDYELDPTSGFPIFGPSQVVTGKVACELKAPLSIIQALIHVRGTCLTQMIVQWNPAQPADKFRCKEKIELCRESTGLVSEKGPFLLPVGTHEWPFQLTFPEISSYTREPRNDYNVQFDARPHHLPPSMQSEWSPGSKAEIRYELEVEVTKAIANTTTTASLPLIFVPSSKIPLPRMQTPIILGVSTMTTLNPQPPKLAIGKALKRLLHRGQSAPENPFLTFSATVHLPLLASIEQPFTASLVIEQQRMSENDPISPEIFLREVVFELISHTHMRSSSQPNSKEYTKSEEYIVGRTKIIGADVPIPLNQHIRSGREIKISHMMPEEGILLPTFKSYTVSHHYEVVAKVAIEHRDSENLFEFEQKFPFTVLPLENNAFIRIPGPEAPMRPRR